jgi:hypothetical protein
MNPWLIFGIGVVTGVGLSGWLIWIWMVTKHDWN